MKKLDDVFNIEPFDRTAIVSQSGNVIVPDQGSTDKNIEYDYEKTRSNLHSLLQQGQDALYHALEVAKQAESPRHFEVVSAMIKNLADINHQLLDLSDKRKKMGSDTKKQESSGPQQVTNNAIFVGSTADLNKMLQNIRGEKNGFTQE